MVSKAKIIQYGAIAVFITGAVLLGVGSAGAATPLIVAGVLLVVVSSGAGFMSTIERRIPSALTYTNPVAPVGRAPAVVSV